MYASTTFYIEFEFVVGNLDRDLNSIFVLLMM